MQILGVDLHARQQAIARLDTDTGELSEKTLKHEAEVVREFYSSLPQPLRVGIEALLRLLWCEAVGHARDAELRRLAIALTGRPDTGLRLHCN